LGLAVVRDLRTARAEPGPEDIAGFETDALAGFVLARGWGLTRPHSFRDDVSRQGTTLRRFLTRAPGTGPVPPVYPPKPLPSIDHQRQLAITARRSLCSSTARFDGQ
jgi:hypothetical protein